MEEYSSWFSITKDDRWLNDTSIDIHLDSYAEYWTWFFRQVRNLQGERCFPAYDNSSKGDIASLALWFPDQTTVLDFNWVPAESIERRSKEDQLPYDLWYKAGIINNTPLARIDEDLVLDCLIGDNGILEYFEGCELVAFDRWGSNHIINKVQDYGHPVASVPQGFQLNNPMKYIESQVTDGSFFHGMNPVLDWMRENTTIKRNNNDYIRPDRENSTDKIDGIVATAMAVFSWQSTLGNTIEELDLNT